MQASSYSLPVRIPGTGHVLLRCFSRLRPYKRLVAGTYLTLLAIDALAWLRACRVPADLVIVGSGPLEATLRRRVEPERLPVHFLPHRADRVQVAALTAAADVALSPGPRETLGLVVLEAMASVPSWSTRTGRPASCWSRARARR